MKSATKTLLSTSSIKRASLLNRVTYNLKLSSSRCFIFSRFVEDLLYLCLPMKCVMKCPLNSLKIDMEFGAILLNLTLASPLSITGNTLHMISLGTPYTCIRVLNDFKWSNGSLDSPYVSTCGIWNLAKRG